MTRQGKDTSRLGDAREAGVALVVVMFVVIMAGGLIMMSSQGLKSLRKRQSTSFHVEGHAYQFARAGLIEAINWFRRQSAQPVTSFAPQLDVMADPKVLDTEDPDVGIVREFQISGKVWGRYEIFKAWPSDPDSDRAALRQHLAVEDLSIALGEARDGLVWRLKCRGIVYKRIHEGKAPHEPPNQLLAVETLQTELRRTLTLNSEISAITIPREDSLNLGSKLRVFGGRKASAIVSQALTGSMTSSATLKGAPPTRSVTTLNTGVIDVFGVSFDDLKLQADYVVSDVTSLPDPIPEGSIVVIDNTGTVTVGPSAPLNGRVIVATNGNLQILPGSLMNLSGFLYVGGNLQIDDGPCWFRGAMVVNGTLTATGSTDFATINYDHKVLADLRVRHTYKVAGAISRF